MPSPQSGAVFLMLLLAGGLAGRQANAPLAQDLYADDVGKSGLYLLSDLSRCVTGVTL